MAGYHLCRHKTADTPFFIENIQVSVRTIEELAYFFGRFPALLDETVMRKELVQWISGETSQTYPVWKQSCCQSSTFSSDTPN